MKIDQILEQIGLTEKYQAPQYPYSVQFIAEKLRLREGQDQMAEWMELPLYVYLVMERCSVDISVKTYVEALRRLEKNYHLHTKNINE